MTLLCSSSINFVLCNTESLAGPKCYPQKSDLIFHLPVAALHWYVFHSSYDTPFSVVVFYGGRSVIFTSVHHRCSLQHLVMLPFPRDLYVPLRNAKNLALSSLHVKNTCHRQYFILIPITSLAVTRENHGKQTIYILLLFV